MFNTWFLRLTKPAARTFSTKYFLCLMNLPSSSHTVYYLLSPLTCILSPVICILYYIPCPVSCVLSPLTYVLYPVMPGSNISTYWAKCIKYFIKVQMLNKSNVRQNIFALFIFCQIICSSKSHFVHSHVVYQRSEDPAVPAVPTFGNFFGDSCFLLFCLLVFFSIVSCILYSMYFILVPKIFLGWNPHIIYT